MTKHLTVVIPAHEPSGHLNDCLAALRECDPKAEHVILVLDGPSWPSEIVDTLAASCEVVVLGAQRGAAAARNEGVRRADSTWIVFVDSDVAVPQNFFSQVRSITESKPAPDAFFGSYDDAPRAPGLFSRYRNLLHHFTHQNGREEASTFWTGCGAVKRLSLIDVGGFNERFHAMEDIELGMRLKKAGFSIRLEKTLQVKHLKQWRLGDIWKTDVQRRALPWARLLMQTGQASRDLNLSLVPRVSGILTVTGALLIAAAWLSAGLGLLGLALLGLVILLNVRFYTLLFRAGGVLVAGAGVLFHLIYYLVSTLVFVFVILEARWAPERRASSTAL